MWTLYEQFIAPEFPLMFRKQITKLLYATPFTYVCNDSSSCNLYASTDWFGTFIAFKIYVVVIQFSPIVGGIIAVKFIVPIHAG